MEPKTKIKREENVLQKYGAIGLLAILLVINIAVTPNFVHINTLWNAVIQSTTVMLLSLGMMMIVATGGIDVSVGSVLAMTSTVLVVCLDAGIGYWALLCAVLAGAAFGAVSGFLIGKFQMQPLIVTLGFMSVGRGLAQQLAGGVLIPLQDATLKQLAYYRVGEVVPIQLFIIIAAIIIFILGVKKTKFGMLVEAYGDNPKATELVGIRVLPLLVAVYAITGMAAGIGGIIETARIAAADPSNIGLDMEMDAIAATAIGGTSMTGGKMNMGGTIIGVFLMQLITMMVNMNNIPYQVSLIVKSCIIVFSVIVQNVKFGKKQGKVAKANG